MEFKVDADGRPIVSYATQARAMLMVDEDRVDLEPNGSPSLAYRARVRSPSGSCYDVYFDDQGGVCTCEAARYGQVCAHLIAAMIAFAESRPLPSAASVAMFDQYQEARASRMHGTGHSLRVCPVCGTPGGHVFGCRNQRGDLDR